MLRFFVVLYDARIFFCLNELGLFTKLLTKLHHLLLGPLEEDWVEVNHAFILQLM